VFASLLLVSSPSLAAPIGFIAFDGGQGPTGDQFAFSVTNLSGGFALFPEFQILDPISFTDWSVLLDDGTTLVDSTTLGSIGPGAFLDGLGQPFSSFLFPSSAAFASLTFTALLSATTFQAMDDLGVITTYVVNSATITATLLPVVGGILAGGELAPLDVDVKAVPEPATLALVAIGAGFILWRGWRRRVAA
jgi:hypothetical protein